MALDAEVIVVGAGVGGCATALHLARRGHDVLLLERTSGPTDKVCGEGLMPSGVDELARLGLGGAVRALGARPFRGIAYHTGGISAEGRFPIGHGLGVRRAHLDALLRDRVRAHPHVELRRGVRVRRIAQIRGGVSVGEGERSWRASVLVGADGMHSTVRRLAVLDAPSRGRHRYGVRVHIEHPQDRAMVDVHLADGLELYLTRTGSDSLNVALLVEKEAMGLLKGDLAGGTRALISRCPAVARQIEGCGWVSEPAVVGPLRQRARRVVGRRLALVGDAAGFIDGITGEGMSLTLIGARIAAEELSPALGGRVPVWLALQRYAARRRAEARDRLRLTELVLAGIRHRALARHVVANLARQPALFGQLLAINAGQLPLRSLGAGGLWRLLVR
jgi:menaquinone-9 beta-reductase